MRPTPNYPDTVMVVAPEQSSNEPFGRRRFLARSLRLAAGVPLLGAASTVLAACSDSLVAPIVVPLFSPNRVLTTGRLERIPFAIVTPDPTLDRGDVALPPDDGLVDVTIRRDGAVVFETSVIGRVVDHDHVGEPDPEHQHANLFRYYALRAQLEEPGIYDLTIGIEGTETEMVIQMFDPEEARVPLVGEPLPAVATPTFDDPSAVDRLCTRFEAPCPFHEVSADAVLAAADRPMALLVATPAFCSTAYCGPVVDTLMSVSDRFPDVAFVHVEVYRNTNEVEDNYADPRIELAPAVVELGLEFEPSLLLVSADGVIVDRIDNVFDATEVAEALTALTV